jgi:hypothetical protein
MLFPFHLYFQEDDSKYVRMDLEFDEALKLGRQRIRDRDNSRVMASMQGALCTSGIW